VDIARALGLESEARRLAAHRDEFRRDLDASLHNALAQHRIDYLPASADRGDFDPTSTTIALSVAGAQCALPRSELRETFERYWRESLARRTGRSEWDAYTPYELRNVGAFVRLGWRERASQLLESFLSDRRPAGWNQWAEVVSRDPRQPRFIGDMPHGWVASDFIQATLDLFAYERQADHALVVAAGLPVAWLDGAGIGIERLRTPYGELTYTVRHDAHRLILALGEGLNAPPGGVVFRWPYEDQPGVARLNGVPLRWEGEPCKGAGKALRIRTFPAIVIVAPAEEGRAPGKG
jgi:hypothetical protein